MKKLIALMLGLMIGAGAFAVYAGGDIYTVTQPTESTTYVITVSGTSTFPVINLNAVQSNNGENMGPVSGDCTFNINTWTKPTGSTSGVTTNWYYRQTSKNTVAGWAGAEQIPIVTGLAHSGNTNYHWVLDLDLNQYLRLECVSGASVATVSHDLIFQSPGGKQ